MSTKIQAKIKILLTISVRYWQIVNAKMPLGDDWHVVIVHLAMSAFLVCFNGWCQVTTNLFQGGAPQLFQPNDPQPALLVDTVVLCADEYQPPDETFPGTHVLRHPYEDSMGVSKVDLVLAMQMGRNVADLVAQNHRVLVSCWAGLNRSGLVSSAALLWLKPTWTPHQVLQWIRTVRPGAMNNACFEKWFLAYGHALRRTARLEDNFNEALFLLL